jgi:hypothetical protein
MIAIFLCAESILKKPFTQSPLKSATSHHSQA